MTFTFADLFCGCGGLGFGFHIRGDFKNVLAADSWRAAAEVCRTNFPNAVVRLIDLSERTQQQVSAEIAGGCDVLLGGPPCQGFSTMGKRRKDDKRSSMVDHFATLCLLARPKLIIMENVRGITTMKHPTGKTYSDAFLERLSDEYTLRAELVDCLDYGLPQTRRRWVVVGVRRCLSQSSAGQDIFWNHISQFRTSARKTLRDAIGDLPHIEAGGGAERILVESGGGKRIEIYNHRAMRHSPNLVRRFSYVPPGGGLPDVPTALLTKHLHRMLAGVYGTGGHIKNIYGRLEWDKPSGTIVAGMDKITCGRFVHPSADRLLTPRECARIQSFPDTFRFAGSLVNQYYMIGNAVPPKISEILAIAARATLDYLVSRPTPISAAAIRTSALAS